MTAPITSSVYAVSNGTVPLSVPYITTRAPASSDLNGPSGPWKIGQFWVNSSANTSYILTSLSASSGAVTATWSSVASGAGALDTLTADSGGAVTPSTGNINILGTANQVTTSGASPVITISLPSVLIAPGSLEVTTTLQVDGATSFTGNVLLSGTLGVSGLTTLAALTQVGTANINASGAATTTIATGGTGALALGNATGNTTLTGSFSTLTAAATITLGTSAQTGKISIGNSTAAMPALDIMNGVAASAQVLNIASGTSITGAQTVNLLSGATPGATTTLNIMGGVGSSGNQVIAALGGTLSQGTNSFSVFAGAFTGGTNSINLFSGAFTTVAATFNLFSGASTSIGTANIGTGSSAAHVTNIGSNAGGNVTIIAGSASTIGIGLGGNAGQLITIGAAAQTAKISIANSTGAMAAVDLMNGVAGGAQVLNIASGTSATGAQTVNLLSGTTPGASQTLNIMCGAASAGTQAVNIASTGATRATTVSIANGNAAHVVVLGSTTASAATTIQAGSGTTGLSLSAAGNVQMAAAVGSSASSPITLAGRVVQATFTGFTTASGSSQVFELTNSAISGTTQAIIVSADNLGSNDAQMSITRVLQAASSLKVTLKNNGAAALNGDVHITAWILN